MKKYYAILYILGLSLLFFVLQYDFDEDETSESWNLPLTGKMIIIDPGHGLPDRGADREDVYESDIAFSIATKLKDYLQGQGALVLMTRENENDLAPADLKGYSKRKTVDLKKRVELINTSGAELFISIHLNATTDTVSRGAVTFYTNKEEGSERMAHFTQDELSRVLENTNRSAKVLNNVYVLKKAEIPGVLVEAGFLSNVTERNLLNTDDYQDKVAFSIYNGTLRYFSNESFKE